MERHHNQLPVLDETRRAYAGDSDNGQSEFDRNKSPWSGERPCCRVTAFEDKEQRPSRLPMRRVVDMTQHCGYPDITLRQVGAPHRPL